VPFVHFVWICTRIKPTEIGCYDNAPWVIEKRISDWSFRPTAVGPVDFEIIGPRGIVKISKKDETEAEHIARRPAVSSRAWCRKPACRIGVSRVNSEVKPICGCQLDRYVVSLLDTGSNLIRAALAGLQADSLVTWEITHRHIWDQQAARVMARPRIGKGSFTAYELNRPATGRPSYTTRSLQTWNWVTFCDPVTRESSDPETLLTRWPCSIMNSKCRLMLQTDVCNGQEVCQFLSLFGVWTLLESKILKIIY